MTRLINLINDIVFISIGAIVIICRMLILILIPLLLIEAFTGYSFIKEYIHPFFK